MTARSIDEPHRTATQLELFFDLTFVVAIAALTSRFAHAVEDGHALDALVPCLQVFFAIWWAWMNHTWFASSFDTDDVAFRLLTLVQMAGVLVLAAGVPAALEDNDYTAVTSGYLVMRVGLIAQWLRAAVEDPASRRTALRYAVGITLADAGWVARLLVADELSDGWLLALFGALTAFELAVPLWAERARPTSWHPHHIAERYGLFAIILLGESVLAAFMGVQRALADDGVSAPLVAVGVAALVLVFALWWLYFLQPVGDGLAASRDRSYLWGYGHYGVFAALALVGAGLEAAVAHAGGQVAASTVAIGYAIAAPVAAFLVLVWWLHVPLIARPVLHPAVMLGGAGAVLLVPLVGASLTVSVGLLALVCAVVVAATLALDRDAWPVLVEPLEAR
ncbi:low temperature requirement protein A [Solirubrobacter sp. CPCC 204708]|nr:low temperature requirement protein A [Solirubrobacter deserti]